MVTSVGTPPSPTPLSAFYSSYLSEEDRPRYEVALTMEGLQGEIALLRVQLGHLCHDDPYNPKMYLRLTNAIDRLTRTQRMLNKDREVQDVDSAISSVESLLSLKRSSGRDARPSASGRSLVGADPRVCPDRVCLDTMVRHDTADSQPDRESMVVGANIDPAPSVHSEQTETGEQPGNLSPCQGACPGLEPGEIERGIRESDQDIAVPPPIIDVRDILLPPAQAMLLFSHGNGRSKKKNHHRH